MTDQGTAPRRVVVVGVDGSDSSIDALEWAAGQAARTGADLEAVTAWQRPLSLGNGLPVATEYDPGGDARTMVDDIVVPVSARYPSVTVRTRAVEGHPADVLVEASRHADLLVVGSRGHGVLSGIVLGSVSQHCAVHATSPVLVHRRPG